MTAVNFIKEKIKKYDALYFVMHLWFEDALEIEKQQLIEAHDKGFDSVQQLNDDYAIEFASWLTFNNLFYSIEFGNDRTKELLEIFKKERGL